METNPGVNAETLNAIVSAMGAIVMCAARQMPPAQRDTFANELAALAKTAEKNGDATLEALLIDLHRAAR